MPGLPQAPSSRLVSRSIAGPWPAHARWSRPACLLGPSWPVIRPGSSNLGLISTLSKMIPLSSVPVSVLVPVKNEQRHIVACLASAAWADEIVVVDSASADETAEIAGRSGARVVQFAYVPGGPRKKNWALQNLHFRNEWILILDADER